MYSMYLESLHDVRVRNTSRLNAEMASLIGNWESDISDESEDDHLDIHKTENLQTIHYLYQIPLGPGAGRLQDSMAQLNRLPSAHGLGAYAVFLPGTVLKDRRCTVHTALYFLYPPPWQLPLFFIG